MQVTTGQTRGPDLQVSDDGHSSDQPTPSRDPLPSYPGKTTRRTFEDAGELRVGRVVVSVGVMMPVDDDARLMNQGSHVEGERQTKPQTGQTRGDYCQWVTTAATLLRQGSHEEGRNQTGNTGRTRGTVCRLWWETYLDLEKRCATFTLRAKVTVAKALTATLLLLITTTSSTSSTSTTANSWI
eukprot:1410116-Rhodomonas_salina.1